MVCFPLPWVPPPLCFSLTMASSKISVGGAEKKEKRGLLNSSALSKTLEEDRQPAPSGCGCRPARLSWMIRCYSFAEAFWGRLRTPPKKKRFRNEKWGTIDKQPPDADKWCGAEMSVQIDSGGKVMMVMPFLTKHFCLDPVLNLVQRKIAPTAVSRPCTRLVRRKRFPH